MGIVQILSDQLTNQIAAGEVVERPASVVKELVENAIDAEATRIVIRMKEGGITYIQVSDNGLGMVREDAVLAFARHATSKLKKERDLFSIQTLGFRGEALPSIASIARVTLTTAYAAEKLGIRVQVDGGEQKAIEEVSRARGTDVVVEDLFFNTPARLKYLKTVNTEISHVADIVGRIAIAHPHISFVLTHQNRELLRTPGDGKLKHVIHAIYGHQVASFLIPFQAENLDFQIHGYMTKPEVTRVSRSYMTLILNGRYIRSLPLTQSIIRAYGTLLPTGRYPIVVIHIQMDPKLTDVNVHPTKLEVRLSKERECRQLIEHCIKKAFQGKALIPQVNTQIAKTNRVVQESLVFDEKKSIQPDVIKEKSVVWDFTTNPILPQKDKKTSRQEKEEKETSFKEEELNKFYEKPMVTKEAIKIFPSMVPLSQIHGTYIVAQTEDGFYLIDQHAAHERIYYETFYRKLGNANQTQQLLLVPITIECSASEAKILQLYLDDLNLWGIEMEPFGGSTFLVRSYPHWFPEESAKDLINEVVEWLKEHGNVDTSLLRDATAKMMACKAAIKANRHLRQDEMEHLISQLRECSNPYTCPHGRPISVHFSTYQLEKMFKRVM